jgi:hypothetical protein
MILSNLFRGNLRLFKIIGPLGLTFFASTVQADTKAYHGAVCQPQWPSYGDQLRYSQSGVHNDGTLGTGSAVVTCPLIRDRIGNATQVADVAIEVFNLSGSFSCTLYSQGEDSDTGSTVDLETQQTFSTGRQQFNFSPLNTTSGNEGSYAVQCVVPTNGTVYQIYVVEDNGSD